MCKWIIIFSSLLVISQAQPAEAILSKSEKETVEGFVTQLIPMSQEYIVGKPMLFRLVLKNTSDKTKWYDDQSLSHSSFTIKDSDGQLIPVKRSSFSTFGGDKSLAAGQSIDVITGRDIAEEYVITKPGKYTVQFLNRRDDILFHAPDSNIVEIDIKDGQPLPNDVLMAKLSDITSAGELYDFGAGSIEKGILKVSLGYCGKGEFACATLWQSDHVLEKTSLDAEEKHSFHKYDKREYLGKSPDNKHYYLMTTGKFDSERPDLKRDIIKKLNLIE